MLVAVSDPAAPRRAVVRPGTLAGLAAAAFLGLYLSSLTATHIYDAYVFAMHAERLVASGAFLDAFHPQHVLYTPTGAAALWVVQVLGVAVGAMPVLQVMSAAGGAALVWLTWRWIATTTGDAWLAGGSAACVGLSAGVWAFATDAECNVPAQALSVAALGPALAWVEGRGGRARLVAASVLLGLAAAYHLTLGTLWIALLVHALVARGAALRRVVVMLAGASLVLAAAYTPRLVELLHGPGALDPASLVTFTGDTAEGGYLLRSGFDPAGQLVAVLHRFAWPPGSTMPPLPGLAPAIVPGAWLLAGAGAVLARAGGAAVRVTGAWFALNVLLFAGWANHEFEFMSFHVAPLGLFGAAGLAALVPARHHRGVGVALAVAALVTGAVTWQGYVAPRRDPRHDGVLATCLALQDATRPGDRILLTGWPERRLKVACIYQARRGVIVPEFFFGPRIDTTESLRRLDRAVRDTCAQGRRVHVMPVLVEDGPVGDRGYPMETVRRHVRTLMPAPSATLPDGSTLYVLPCPDG
jgi:hypothetical protein